MNVIFRAYVSIHIGNKKQLKYVMIKPIENNRKKRMSKKLKHKRMSDKSYTRLQRMKKQLKNNIDIFLHIKEKGIPRRR